MTYGRTFGNSVRVVEAEPEQPRRTYPGQPQPAGSALPAPGGVTAPQSELMVGDSAAMRRVFDLIRRFAAIEVPVLITGETGTGKELTARALHERSQHGAGPFMAINCAALPENLIASELFGYEKGAFTGAHARKPGLIELADGGTLFLDEIGDLPLDLQGHLLRFLQENQIFRLGGRQAVSVQTRVIAATHVDLRRAIAAGRFREDLFYRLNVLVIPMPPLRDRGADIDLMATVFLRQIAADMRREIDGYTDDARAALRAHAWPGNVRELIATIRRAVVMANDRWIGTQDLGLPADSAVPPAPSHRGRTAVDRRQVVECLMRNGQNRSRAARELGISRVTLYRVLRRTEDSETPQEDG